jgi:sodium bicarbonate transporter 10
MTLIMISVMIGLSVFMTPILTYIPMPVLFGVFLYMGTSPLADMQFYDRLLLLFMPTKYQPDHIYLRKVTLRRVHLFTFIQLLCFILLWAVKEINTISIAFPLMVSNGPDDKYNNANSLIYLEKVGRHDWCEEISRLHFHQIRIESS